MESDTAYHQFSLFCFGMISQRAAKWVETKYGLMEGMELASSRPFDLDTKPEGCINLGTAENELMFDILAQKCAESRSHILEREDIRYGDMVGVSKLRSSLARFFNHFLRVPRSIEILPDEITLHNGCGSAVESLFHVLCDPGDGVLIPSPYYGGFDMDIERRAGVKLCAVDGFSMDSYSLTREALTAALQRSQDQGITTVRAVLLMNPVNPTGLVYTEETIRMVCSFCEEHDIHLVMDEIYIFSLFRKGRVGRFHYV